MHKLLFGAALFAVSLHVSAAGCLGLAPAAKQACLDKIVATLPEESPEQKARSAAWGAVMTESSRQIRTDIDARRAAEARALQAERERAAQQQAYQQAVAAQQRRDAVAEETLRQLQIQAAQAQQQQEYARPAPVHPTYRAPLRCNPRNGWCD